MFYPILYSLQHCPYAMRARMGLLLANQTVLFRAITMKDKPTEMLRLSPKGTVPVLVIDELTIIDESLDIMIWALHQNDPYNLLYSNDPYTFSKMIELIRFNDNEFYGWLKKYKQAKRYHETTEIEYQQKCEVFLIKLEQCLSQSTFLMGKSLSLADFAILPFIRQLARVNRPWFKQAPYPKLQQWLKFHLQSLLFSKIMKEYPLWLDSHEDIFFGESILKL